MPLPPTTPRRPKPRVAAAVKLCISLAFANFLGAFLLGTIAGLGKLGVTVPGHQLTILALLETGPLLGSRLMPVYGVCGLLGFLAQMVVGVAARLWPLYAWQRTFAATGYRQPPGSPHGLADPRLRWIVRSPSVLKGSRAAPGSVD